MNAHLTVLVTRLTRWGCLFWNILFFRVQFARVRPAATECRLRGTKQYFPMPGSLAWELSGAWDETAYQPATKETIISSTKREDLDCSICEPSLMQTSQFLSHSRYHGFMTMSYNDHSLQAKVREIHARISTERLDLEVDRQPFCILSSLEFLCVH